MWSVMDTQQPYQQRTDSECSILLQRKIADSHYMSLTLVGSTEPSVPKASVIEWFDHKIKIFSGSSSLPFV